MSNTYQTISVEGADTQDDRVLGLGAPSGDDGRGVASVSVNGLGHLIVTFTDASTWDAGYVVGPQGPIGGPGPIGNLGPSGRGIKSVALNGSYQLVITYTDDDVTNVGNVRGAPGETGGQGNPGPAGRGIANATINGAGHLIITYSDGSTYDAGYAVGPPGPGTGDVLGAAASLEGELPLFTGTNGKAIKRTNTVISSFVLGLLSSGSSAAFLAALGAAATSDLNLIQQGIRVCALAIAELRGDRMNMVDGIADPFSDTSDVASVTGATFDGASKGFLSDTAYSNVQSSTFAISSTQAGSQVATLAFDANLSTYFQPSTSGGTGWIGQDFGSGNKKDVRRVVLSNLAGFASSPTAAVLEWCDDTGTLTNWTALQSFTILSAQAAVSTLTVTVPSVGAKRAWRLRETNGSAAWYVAELTMATAAIQPIALTSATFVSDLPSPTTARLAIQITPQPTVTLTLDSDLIGLVSRDGGTTFTAVSLTFVEALADGTALYEGLATISGQPAGSSMKYRITTAAGKAVFLAGVVLQWRS